MFCQNYHVGFIREDISRFLIFEFRISWKPTYKNNPAYTTMMRIVGKKELITLKHEVPLNRFNTHLGILCDDNQVIKGIAINFFHKEK